MCNGSCTCDMTDASIEQLAWPQRLGFGLSDTLGFMCEIFWMMEVITGIFNWSLAVHGTRASIDHEMACN